MGLVVYALKYRITFYVMSILILLAGIGGYIIMPKDVLPEVNIPVVTVVWTYTGLDTPTMEKRVTTYSEFALSNNVNGIRNMESTTLQGVTITRVYFQPDVSIDLALSQVTAATNSVRAALPPGINPPIVMRFSASTVPVIQLAMSSQQENERQLYDYAQYRIRQTLTTVPGSTLPSPYGGAPRQIMVDLDLHALQAYGLTSADVTNAVTAQNVTVPSGLAKFGTKQYVIRLNSTPEAINALNQVPIKIVNGTPVLIRDVAYVRDGGPPQQNIVRQNGVRGVLLTILKNGNASTLSVVNTVKTLLPGIHAAAPKDMNITPLFDQSVFVAGAIDDVLREGAIAAGLTGLMILLFLGSWRSTLIVLVSIPLSILTSLAGLAALGETVNIMTLGGLALAVGILVDDATVAIENTYRLLEEGHEFKYSVVHGAAGIAKPALISTLSICCAFVSVTFLTDAPKFLFTPQALAVVFGMLASYVLSRTLVPILIDVLVKNEKHGHDPNAKPTNIFGHIRAGFERWFTKFHRGYVGLLHAVIRHRVATLSTAGAIVACAVVLFMFVGTDYFPGIDAGQMTLHVRAPPGTRIEQAELLFQQVEDTIRQVVPRNEMGNIIDNIGLPASNYNFAFGNGTFVAYNDGQILVTLAPGHGSTFKYQKRLRALLHQRFPDSIFYFEAADIITQILDFGVPSQIDVQISGRHPAKDLQVAQTLASKLRMVRGAVDVHVQQITNAPEFFVQVDRQRAAELGLNEQQVATDMNVSLAGSFQVSPNFWSDPVTGIPYQVWVQTPEYRNDTMASITNTPLLVSANGGTDPSAVQLLSNVATLSRGTEQTVSNHVNTQPTFDVYAAVQDRDLGGVEHDIDRIVADQQKQLEAPDHISVRGQIQSKDEAFYHIGIGLVVAMVAVYLLMAMNFQTWGDPFVVIAALPLAFCGIVASLFITQTTFSIPSLMGAIMSVGVASANSILLVTFAREHREATGCSAVEAAIAAGETRLRPVLMTAGAMFVGLLPMAIGIGEGSEQNAALARAVLGGIAVGTCSTLLFVPFLYSVLRRGEAKPLEDYL
ncbi:MAG TPA: efflux RND transporter permease subunit [Rhodopila sp.]|nr:efflux RND transporter permease subunit [Rhodopila sp.]